MMGILVMGLALIACSTARPSAAGPATAPTAPPTPTDSAEVTPTPTESPPPTAEPVPALGDFQSHGAVTISFSSPPVPAVTVRVICVWAPGPAVADWDPTDEFSVQLSSVLAGELVGLEFNPKATSSRGSGSHYFSWGSPMFVIARGDDVASYVPGQETGTVELVEASGDWASGTIRFDGPAPDPESAPPGPLPSPLSDWIRPLGGDPAMASLSGAVT